MSDFRIRKIACKLIVLTFLRRKYMKENGVDIMHLNAIASAFLDCDEEERAGSITKK
jgi:hypothetical protein